MAKDIVNVSQSDKWQYELGTVTTSCTCDNTKSPATVAKDNQNKHIGRVQDRPIRAAHIYSRYTEINILRPVLSLVLSFIVGNQPHSCNLLNWIICNRSILQKSCLEYNIMQPHHPCHSCTRGQQQYQYVVYLVPFQCRALCSSAVQKGALPVSLFLWDNNPYPHSHGAVETLLACTSCWVHTKRQRTAERSSSPTRNILNTRLAIILIRKSAINQFW